MKTLLLTTTLIVSVSTAAHAWDTTINNGGRGGTGYGGLGGAGGSSASQSISAAAASANAAAQSRSGSVSGIAIAPGAIGSGNTGGSVEVRGSPSFGLGGFGSGQCPGVGVGVGVTPSGGGLIQVGWESTNCRNYYIALAMIGEGKVAEGWELMGMITPEAAKVLAGHPDAPHPAAVHPVAYTPMRTFDCDKVRQDTGRGRMSDEDMAIYRSCH